MKKLLSLLVIGLLLTGCTNKTSEPTEQIKPVDDVKYRCVKDCWLSDRGVSP
jgi:PBP1b-binding outer membrane lipoprotein LpoB